MLGRVFISILLFVLAVAPAAGAEAPELLPTPACAAGSFASDITADGTVLYYAQGCEDGPGRTYLARPDGAVEQIFSDAWVPAIADDGTLVFSRGADSWVRFGGDDALLGVVAPENRAAPRDVASGGLVVGNTERPAPGGGFYSRAVSWDAQGQRSPLFGLSESVSSSATAVNEEGDIIGSSFNSRGATGYVQQGASIAQLTPLYSSRTVSDARPQGISRAGQIVGASADKGGKVLPVFWPNPAAKPVVVSVPRRTSIQLNVVNSSGVAAGWTYGSGVQRAAVWSQARGVVDLNTLLPAGSNVFLRAVEDINDAGQISGHALVTDPNTGNRVDRAFRMQLP